MRNTAVPGTLYGCFLSSNWIRLSIGVSRRRVLMARMRAPLRQVSITTITMAPIKSGTPELCLRSMADIEARQEAELNRLPSQRIGARNHRLARDDGSGQ